MFTAIQKMPHWILLVLISASATGMLDASEVEVGNQVLAQSLSVSLEVLPE